MPVCNPDGRSHVPFNNYVGKTFRELRYYNQGTWKDGSLCGWPQCKRFFPIKDYVENAFENVLDKTFYEEGYSWDEGKTIDFFSVITGDTYHVLYRDGEPVELYYVK